MRRPLGDAALEKWKAAVEAKAAAVEKPELKESKKAGEKLAGKGDEVDKRKKKTDELAKDAKSRQKPPPEEPARQPEIEPSPLVAFLDAVESKAQLKLSNQSIPAMSPLPVYPGLTAADFLPGKETKPPTPDAGGEGKQGPGAAATPVAKDPKADATKSKVDEKTVEPQPAPAPQPIDFEDKGAAKLAPPPKEQGEQIVEVLAAVERKSLQHAKAITDAGKKALGRPTGIPSLDQLATDEIPAVQVDVRTELDAIAASAGFTKEQLDARILGLKEDATKQAEEVGETIAAEDTKAKAKVKAAGDEEAGAIAGIARANIEEAEEKAAAAQGQPDPAVIERRRDDFLGKIDTAVATGMARYRAAGDKRLEEIDGGIRQQKAAYASAVTAQVRAIRRHVDPDGTKMEEAARATRPTEEFGRRKAGELEALRTQLRVAASAEAAKYGSDLFAAGTEARNKVRDWAAKETGTERSWWRRLLDMLSDWMKQSTASTKAWEEQRAAESRDAIANDFTMLADMRQLLEEQKTGEFSAQLAKLSDSQRAIVLAYLKGGGNDAIGAIADGTIERIKVRKAPELAKKWEDKAAAHWTDWIELQTLARAKNPGFNAQEIGNNVRGAVAQVGTDESKLFANLAKARTAVERRAVDRYYLAMFDTTIRDDVESDTSGDEEDRAVALMEGRTADAAAAALDDAIGYVSDDEDAIYEQLRGKTPEERREIAEAFKQRTGKELKGVLDDSLSGAELDQASLLLQNRDDEAVAAELQVAFEVWNGTDEDAVGKVFERNRQAVEAEAKQRGWSTAEVEAEVKRRNQAVANAYEKKYDKPLSVALGEEMSGEDLALANAQVSGNQTDIDAAKLRVEQDSWVYVSDDRVEDVMRNQRTRAETEFDRELERKRVYLMERQNAGDFTEEEWKARKQEIQAEKAARDETVRKQSKQYMDQLATKFDQAPGGKAGDFVEMLDEDLSGASRDEALALYGKGALSAEEDLFYGVEGLGTDVDQLKQALKGKTRDEIKAIEARYNEKYKPRTLWGDLGEDLSGRDYTDVMAEVIYGEPQTPQELRDKLKFKASMDKSGLWDDLFGDDLNVAGQISELDRAIAAMEAAEASGDPEKIAQATDLVNAMNTGLAAGIENSRIVADSVIDTAAQVGAAVVGIVVTIATMGGGAPLAAAAWGAMAASAAAGAAASMVTGLVIKTALKGGNMSLEEFGTDLAVGGVDILTAVATAGLSKVILNSATMKALAGPTARKLVQNLAAGGAEAIENLLGSLPSGAAQALLDPALWSSDDPLLGIVKALGQAGAMGVVGGAVIGGGLGQLHGVYQAAKGIDVPKPPGIDPDVLVPTAKEHLKGQGIPVDEGTTPRIDGDGASGGGAAAKGVGNGTAPTVRPDPAATGGTPGKVDADATTKPPATDTPEPRPLRTALSDTDLAALGMPEFSVQSFKAFADGYGLVIDVRPTNPDASARLRSGEALPKPEILKQKTINDLDVMLGIDPKHKGLVGHLDPAQMQVPKEGTTLVHPTTGETITVDAALAKELGDRRAKRTKDFADYAKTVKDLLDSGQFSIEPPGIIKFGMGPDAKAFTSDHDVFDFRRKDGKAMTPAEYDFYVQQMREWGMNVEHGAHLHWDTLDPTKLDIAKGHGPGGEPLIRFGEGGTVKEAWWDGRLDAQKDLGASSDTVRPGGDFAGARTLPGADVVPSGVHPGLKVVTVDGHTIRAHPVLGLVRCTSCAPLRKRFAAVLALKGSAELRKKLRQLDERVKTALAGKGRDQALRRIDDAKRKAQDIADPTKRKARLAELEAKRQKVLTDRDAKIAGLEAEVAALGTKLEERKKLVALQPLERRLAKLGGGIAPMLRNLSDAERARMRGLLNDKNVQELVSLGLEPKDLPRYLRDMVKGQATLDPATFGGVGKSWLSGGAGEGAQLRDKVRRGVADGLALDPAKAKQAAAQLDAVGRLASTIDLRGDPVVAYIKLRRLQTLVSHAHSAVENAKTKFRVATETTGGGRRRGEKLNHERITVSAEGAITEPIHRQRGEDVLIKPDKVLDALEDVPAHLRADVRRLIEGTERAHLVGPGFGTDLSEGVMYAPSAFNQGVQNRYVEDIIRRAQEEGYELHLSAQARGRHYEVPRTSGDPLVLNVLDSVTYTITTGRGSQITILVNVNPSIEPRVIITSAGAGAGPSWPTFEDWTRLKSQAAEEAKAEKAKAEKAKRRAARRAHAA